MFRPTHLTFVSLLLCSAASYASNNCESIRTQIDAKVRAGVANFVLSVVEASTRVSGKVVGTCDLGTKKIAYNPSSMSAPPRPRASPAEEPILTECKDGSVTVGGDCKK
jgi:hypothetical protein